MKKLRVLLFAACLIAILSAGAAQAATVSSGKIGTLKWTYDDQGTLTISGSGELTPQKDSWGFNSYPWTSDWSYGDITSVKVKSGVTAIGEDAFAYMDMLQTASIAGSVKTIGSRAFTGCMSLSKLTLYKGIQTIGEQAFCCCMSLQTVKLPVSVRTIGQEAFATCCGISSLTIPEGVETIRDFAFMGCDLLNTLSIPSSVTEIGIGAFNGCTNLTKLTLHKGLKKLGREAFGSCWSLKTVTLPSSVTSIGVNPFNGCSSLTAVKVNSSNQKFTSYNGALYNKDKTVLYCYPSGKTATSLTIPSTVKTIKEFAFAGCALTSVTVPSSVKSINARGFSQCYNLEKITVNSKNSNYSSKDGVLFNKKQTTLICYPSGKSGGYYSVPAGVTKIGTSAFLNVFSLQVVNLPKGVTAIGEEAFYCCPLTDVCLPASLTEIGENAFFGCDDLRTVKYCGSKSQWKKITIHDEMYGNDFGNRKIVYSYKDVKPTKAPKITVQTDTDYGMVQISWKAVSGASFYKIYRSTSKDGSFKLIGTTADTEYYSLTGTPGKTYYFKVKAASVQNAAGPYSNCVSGKYVLAIPMVVDKLSGDRGKPCLIFIDPMDSSHVKKFTIYRATSKSGTYSKIGEVQYDSKAQGIYSFTDTTAKSGKTYWYKIKAIASTGSAGNSKYSTPEKFKVS